jgi:hypothetical protein
MQERAGLGKALDGLDWVGDSGKGQTVKHENLQACGFGRHDEDWVEYTGGKGRVIIHQSDSPRV